MRSLNTTMLHAHVAIPFLPYPYLVKQAIVKSKQKFNSFRGDFETQDVKKLFKNCKNPKNLQEYIGILHGCTHRYKHSWHNPPYVPIHLPPRKYQAKEDNHLFEKELNKKK
jgi:hypothetical protein